MGVGGHHAPLDVAVHDRGTLAYERVPQRRVGAYLGAGADRRGAVQRVPGSRVTSGASDTVTSIQVVAGSTTVTPARILRRAPGRAGAADGRRAARGR